MSFPLIIKFALLLFDLPSFLHPDPSSRFFVIRPVVDVATAAVCSKPVTRWDGAGIEAMPSANIFNA
ncbi:hypothetical protein HX870_02715 [Pseudomonas gingeri]|uniref:hypothetical protein n=1 Tax=Pseudomonas gingeri TaxID=117681 RepID=UPI0015A2860B|nr:hypothetical protein [Pseudomonas gingeri]NWA29589.1 hypothetical protein [Pseudomonas gingeri]NWD66536.1 hypothetical protein [Pseudomonas gingeri]NWD73358.1 hypothetical protein [Pseudomonas gingeri]